MSKATETIVAAAPNVMDQFLNKSIEYLSSAEAFLKAEVPAFIQEFMTWKLYESVIDLVGTVVLIGILSFSCNKFYKANKKHNENKYGSHEGLVMGFIMTGLAAFALLVALAQPIQKIIKIKVAPRRSKTTY